MSKPILSIPTALPTRTLSTSSSTGSLSITLLPSSVSTSATSISSGTTSLPPSISTTISTSTSSLLTSSTSETSITTSSNTPIPSSTSPPPLQSTSSSVSSTDITTVVTSVDDHTSTSTSLLPTTFAQSNSNDLVSRRTAIIAGTTTGLIALILIILGAIFIHRRHKLRKVLELSGKQKEGRSLLDGEEFDDDERNIPSMRSYPHHHPTYSFHPAAVSSSPSLLKTRTAETGSIFREEVWPPPGFIDPITKQSNQVDLSGIVHDVMGPSTSYKPRHNPSPSTSSFNTNSRPSTGSHEGRQPTGASTVSAFSSTSTSPLFTDKWHSEPFRSDLGPSISISPLPAGALAPVMPGSSSTYSYPSTSSVRSQSPSGMARSGSPNTQPQKSSPLARASTGDTKLWLTRTIQPTDRTERTTSP